MSYRHGEALYEIEIENPQHFERGVIWVEMDGKRINDGLITLDQDLVKHHVLVRMGQPLQAGKVKKSQLRSPVE